MKNKKEEKNVFMTSPLTPLLTTSSCVGNRCGGGAEGQQSTQAGGRGHSRELFSTPGQ